MVRNVRRFPLHKSKPADAPMAYTRMLVAGSAFYSASLSCDAHRNKPLYDRDGAVNDVLMQVIERQDCRRNSTKAAVRIMRRRPLARSKDGIV